MKRIRVESAITLNGTGKAGLWMIALGAVAYVLSTLVVPGVVEGAARNYMLRMEQLRALSFIAGVSPAVVVGGFALLLIGRGYVHDVDILDIPAKSARAENSPLRPSYSSSERTVTDWDRVKSGESKGFGPGLNISGSDG